MIKEVEDKGPGPAENIVGVAKEKGYIKGALAVLPEILENEKLFLAFTAKAIGEYVKSREREELETREIYNLFIFVYAKAAETVSDWKMGNRFSVRPAGMFSEKVPFEVIPELGEFYKEQNAVDDFFKAFEDWLIRRPGESRREYHPLLPLLEAVKWIYRIATGMGLDFLENKKNNGSS